MGRRRGRTGAGGAVVSSLSENAGGTLKSKRKQGESGAGSSSSQRRNNDDIEIEFLANPNKSKNGKEASSSTAAPSSSLSAPSTAPKWLGKSPNQMLREWCAKNNRKRPYFSKMNSSDGIMRCTIPPGRKDGKKAKGSAFDIIVGVGEKPGEDYAALNVLHQVERGKPLERLLAPEFRGIWLDLDKRYDELQKEEARRTFLQSKRKQNAERREKMEKAKESATINISAASRQVIEDALLEQKVTSHSAAGPATLPSSSGESGSNSENKVYNELIRMGFAPFDAADASSRFSNVNKALDYLCLSLDESELPSSFAPTSDFEVVQFHSASDGQTRGFIDPFQRDILTNLTCMSKYSAEKAIRASGGSFLKAVSMLYNTLTHNVLSDCIFPDLDSELRNLALEEKQTEAETLFAIYGEDAKIGIGALRHFKEQWSAVIRIDQGLHGVRSSESIYIAVVDIDGFYPYSAPLVLVASSFEMNTDERDSLGAPSRRVAMRAATSELLRIRESLAEDEHGAENHPHTVPVVYNVVSFLTEASEQDIISAASSRRSLGNTSDEASPVTQQQPSSTKGTSANVAHQLKGASKKNTERPMVVNPLPQSPDLVAMQSRRKSLPAHKARAQILEKIRENQVVVVSGATGSGKTTQVPQFLLEEAADRKQPVSIICTQPRRIAAMSVAERVAAERCQKVGESVGYQVKLNTKRSRSTRLTFCTTGVLLRRLQGDPKLNALTHVLVDEVHERSVETDFLLLLLREIARERPKLRIILMSATLDASKFANYFSNGFKSKGSKQVPIISIPGRTFPVEEYYLDEAVSLSGYQLKPGDKYARRTGKIAHNRKYGPEPVEGAILPAQRNSATLAAQADDPVSDESEDASDTFDDHGQVEGLSQSKYSYVRSEKQPEAISKQTTALIDESMVNVDLIDLLVKQIDRNRQNENDNGAVLIFLPGVAEISAVIRKLSIGAGAKNLWALPLHSLLSPDDQNLVFQRAPKGKRKVICATNIAETSITVEDITIVIDTLRAKEMSYDALNSSSVLSECFISKAAAKQRAGRAGRVSQGTCYRLVRKHTFENKIAAQQVPEIRRVALEHLVLNVLSIIPDSQSENDPHAFLAKAVDPPDPQSISSAVTNLIQIGALERIDGSNSDNAVALTALGKHLSGLPVDARIGKLLIYGSLFGCLDPALTIAATISERSPFYAPFDKREEARAARLPFVWGKSDLLTYVKAFNAWRDLRDRREGYSAEQDFCSANFLSRKTLITISDGRKQLADALVDAGFGLPGSSKVTLGWEREDVLNTYSNNVRVLKAVTCAALYPNIARIDLPDKTYYEVKAGTVAHKYNSKDLRLRSKTGERLFLHPESVNFFEGNYETRWLAYYAKVKTSRLYLRDSTMVSPYAIMLFGGEIGVQHERGQMSVDSWVIFKAPARVSVLVRELRRELDALLLRKFEDAELDLALAGRTVNDAIIRLITSES